MLTKNMEYLGKIFSNYRFVCTAQMYDFKSPTLTKCDRGVTHWLTVPSPVPSASQSRVYLCTAAIPIGSLITKMSLSGAATSTRSQCVKTCLWYSLIWSEAAFSHDDPGKCPSSDCNHCALAEHLTRASIYGKKFIDMQTYKECTGAS